MSESEKKEGDDPDRKLVRVYDLETKTITWIPAAELAPGMIQTQSEGIEGTVWVKSSQLKLGTFQHPPFPEDVRDLLRTLKSRLDEVYPMSLEGWEDGFRRDRNPNREIAYWLYLSDVYTRLVASETGAENFTRRRDIFKVLAACGLSPREQVLKVVTYGSLSREEAQAVVDAFHQNAR